MAGSQRAFQNRQRLPVVSFGFFGPAELEIGLGQIVSMNGDNGVLRVKNAFENSQSSQGKSLRFLKVTQQPRGLGQGAEAFGEPVILGSEVLGFADGCPKGSGRLLVAALFERSKSGLVLDSPPGLDILRGERGPRPHRREQQKRH